MDVEDLRDLEQTPNTSPTNDTIDVMIHLETLGSSSRAAVLSVCAHRFDRFDLSREFPNLYCRMNLYAYDNPALRTSFDMCYSAMGRWMQQSDEARTEAFDGSWTLTQTYSELTMFLARCRSVGKHLILWSLDSEFPALRNLCQVVEPHRTVPWQLSEQRHLRTYLDAADVSLSDFFQRKKRRRYEPICYYTPEEHVRAQIEAFHEAHRVLSGRRAAERVE